MKARVLGAESTTPLNSSFDPTPTYVANGLTNGTTYYFTVQAVNGVGPSTSSNEASASPVAGRTGGYWEVASDGGVFSFGNAGSFGSAAGLHPEPPRGGLAPTHDRQGYWLVASDGGIFTYGDAHFYGSTGGMTLNKPIVGMAATTDGGGYWLVASDGGIFAYGDAHFYGSTGGMALNKPIVGMAVTPDGGGYWLVASDGGIFAYGDAALLRIHRRHGPQQAHRRHGGQSCTAAATGWSPPTAASSTTAVRPSRARPAVPRSTSPSSAWLLQPDGAGYWLVASDGGIFNYGSAGFFGSTGGMTLNMPVIGMG